MGVPDFVERYIGTRVTASGGLGGECVDLANQWIAECCGLAHVFRNAITWAGPGLPHMKWTGNRPDNAPLPGSLVVWEETPSLGIGVFGHIALVVAADEMAIVSFDQNWSEGEVCALNVHSYAGVLGWQSPNA